MARIFTEGFEMGDNLGFGASGTVYSTPVRSGNYSISRGQYAHNVDDLSEVYVRLGWYPRSGYEASTYDTYIMFRNGTTTLAHIRLNASNGIDAYVNNVKVADGGVSPFAADTWWLVEIHFKLDDANGVIQTKINGILDIDYSGDTKPDASTVFDNIYFNQSSLTASQYLDDIAINDTTGSEDNSWCGDGHSVCIKPNADGDNIDLTGSDEDKTDNYAMVDDIPSDGDTTYVYGDTVDDYDLYELTAPSLPTNHTITRIWAEARAKDPDTGDIALMIKAGTTEDDSDDTTLTTAYSAIKGEEYLLNPDDSEAWEAADLNDLQVGVKIRS